MGKATEMDANRKVQKLPVEREELASQTCLHIQIFKATVMHYIILHNITLHTLYNICYLCVNKCSQPDSGVSMWSFP